MHCRYTNKKGKRYCYYTPVLHRRMGALARGHRWLRQIEGGQARNLAEIADREKIDRSYVSRMVNLTTLAPDIQAAILDETLPEEVVLFDLAIDTPLCWQAQRQRVADVVAQVRAGKT